MESKKSAFIWNTIGNTSNAFISLVLLIVVNWLLGKNDGGIFSFAFSNAYVFYTIGAFSVRTYQVTDIQKLNRVEHYIALRYISCTVMVLAVFGYVLFNRSGPYKAGVIVLLALYKCVDALSDVFQGSLQTKGHLEIAGKGMFYRAVVSVAMFIVIIVAVKNLLLASLMAVLANLAVFLSYDLRQASRFDTIRPDFRFHAILPIFVSCLPIFLSDICWRYIFLAPKYPINSLLGDNIQNIFGIISAPASVINLVGTFMFYPILVGFAKKYYDNQRRGFVKIILVLLGLLALVTVLAEIVTYFIGIPVLNILYNINLNPYKTDLLLLMLAGGFGASSNVFTYVLTIMRRQKLMLFGNLISAVFAFGISEYFVRHAGINGAAEANLLTMIWVFLVLGFIAAVLIRFRWDAGPSAAKIGDAVR